MFSILAGAFDKEYTMAGTVIYVLATYALMLAAFHHARSRRFHVPVMIFIMISDLLFPIYLVMTRDWYQRLIVDEDILTFGVWVHFMLAGHALRSLLRADPGGPPPVARGVRPACSSGTPCAGNGNSAGARLCHSDGRIAGAACRRRGISHPLARQTPTIPPLNVGD